MRQQRWIELFSDYDYEIRYYLRKANVVADAFSRKERVKPRRVKAMSMTIRSSVMDKILDAQGEASKVIVDKLTKPVHFLARRGDYSTEKLARVYIDEIVARHGVLLLIISYRYGRFTSHFWQTLQKALGTRLDMSTAYHPQIDGLSDRTIQTLKDMLRSSLYGRKYRLPVLWAEIGESRLIGPELVQETTEKVVLIKEKLKATRDHQKSYADNRRKPLEFEVGDRVLSNVSPWKGVIRFGKKEIMDREVKTLKRSKIPIVKVYLNSKRGPEFTWERKDHMKAKYP
nr:putative reverse transcriptase domain-containing protein [Tanacetum cinerariifolium]